MIFNHILLYILISLLFISSIIIKNNNIFKSNIYLKKLKFKKLLNSINIPSTNLLLKKQTYDIEGNSKSQVIIYTGRYETNIIKLKEIAAPFYHSIITVLKWGAYGHDINLLGKIAALHGSIGVLEDYEAAVIYKLIDKNNSLMRLRPASYNEMKRAADHKLNINEWIGNYKSLEYADRIGQEIERPLPVQIFLFDHYNSPKGFDIKTKEELQNIMNTIDSNTVDVRGFMMHLGYLHGRPAEDRTKLFLDIVCPVAIEYANNLPESHPPLQIHWVASDEITRLFDTATGKLKPPQISDACGNHPRINFLIRVGSATYGLEPQINAYTKNVIKPILRWSVPITKIDSHGSNFVATIPVGYIDGYPYPIKDVNNMPFATINGERSFIVSRPAGHEMKIYVSKNIKVGDLAHLLDDNMTVGDLKSKYISMDAYNIAMCITRALPFRVLGTSYPLLDAEENEYENYPCEMVHLPKIKKFKSYDDEEEEDDDDDEDYDEDDE